MSTNKESTECHLTPRRWERCVERVDFQGVTKKEAPNDIVITKVFRETMSSAFRGLKKL